MALATNLGFPRIGAKRELKQTLENYWSGKSDQSVLQEECRQLRQSNWLLQQQLGLDHIPSNDFSPYDHVLDTAAMVGAIPARYQWENKIVDLRTYFAMARGTQYGQNGNADVYPAVDVRAMEMTKWFDTNYHYIVPEFERGQQFRLASTKAVDEFLEAKALGSHTRPVLLGPVSFLLLGKSLQKDIPPLYLLDDLVPVYQEVLRRLADAGADWVQIDEPCLVLNLHPEARKALHVAYHQLTEAAPSLRLLVATYFGSLRENLSTVLKLPVAAVHLDLVRAPQQLEAALAAVPEHLSLSLGVVNGRNVWRTDLEHALAQVEQATRALGSERVMVAPSCSLLHSPVDLDSETELEHDLRGWLAFSKQKVEEVVLLARAVSRGRHAVEKELKANRAVMDRRSTSPRIHNQAVKERAATITGEMLRRNNPYPVRREAQRQHLDLPPCPTTTIGSFPQTKEVRDARAAFKAGRMDSAGYESFLKNEIEKTIRFQEEIGLDVLVHGESERSDMVEYFGERFQGIAFTSNGWVQSYGSRCVRPPVIYGDVHRPEPMTVRWSQYAQLLTSRPVKGMLTGPVTILQWSFVRDDQPRAETCRQIALAIRDEVADLEAANIKVIQIDEPAFREGLPLSRDEWDAYLAWAVDCFRLASSVASNETQIHTHMCYSEFNDVIEAIAAMDADVISIESSRSRMEILDAFATYRYPNEIGPGIYDIHSPRVPSQDEMEALLRKALEVLSLEQLWANPDCGLKTRRWEDVRLALTNMVGAARSLRPALDSSAK